MAPDISFIKGVKNPANDFRPVAFWFLNHYMREDEMGRQIAEMADKGFGGIMLHARDGLRIGYLDVEWRKTVDFCIRAAVKHNLSVWLYDELNYPTGPAGGKLYDYFPECSMQCLKASYEKNIPAGGAAEIIRSESAVCAFAVAQDGKTENLMPLIAGDGVVQWENSTGGPVSIITLEQKEDPSGFNKFPDYFDKEAMRKFVSISYDWYAGEFGKYFGTVIKGEFTDNSCASFGYVRRSVPWSKDFPERFSLRVGRPVEDVLPGVFFDIPQSKECRLIFWRFINDEYRDSFIKPIDDSCRKNGILSTGHYCIEDGNSEHIRQLGDRFDQKRNQGLPGVDMLGRENLDEMDDLLRMKQRDSLSLSIPGTSCPAYFSAGSRTMCECMGLAGGWNLDLAEIKRTTGLLAVLGTDLFVPHGIYYSIAGHRKWESFPDHYHSPIWVHYKEWSDWISKLCYLTSYGERTSQTALLYPVSSQEAHIALGGPENSRGGRGHVCEMIDMTFRAAGNFLLENNIPYEIIDETYIQGASIENGMLCVKAANGKKVSFKALVLPCAKVLDEKTFKMLQQWRKVGGQIVALNSATEDLFDPEKRKLSVVPTGKTYDLLVSFNSEDELKARPGELLDFIAKHTERSIQISGAQGKIVSKEWMKNGFSFCLLHNISRSEIRGASISFSGENVPFILDLDTAELLEVAEKTADGKCFFKYDFPPAETVVIVSGKGLEPSAKKSTRTCKSEMGIIGAWNFRTHKPNALPLRDCRTTFNKDTQTSVFAFNVEVIPESAGLAIDEEMTDRELFFGRYFDRLRCYLNGQLITGLAPGKTFDRWIFEACITKLISKGLNELKIEKASSLLDYARHGDSPIIFGNFGVDKGSLSRPKSELPIGDWAEHGYPYYSGTASYSKRIVLPSEFQNCPLELSFGRPGNSAEIRVCGKGAGVRIAAPWSVDISEFSVKKELDIEITIANTQSNLWGGAHTASGLLGPVKIRRF
jgi:hypothetical protein